MLNNTASLRRDHKHTHVKQHTPFKQLFLLHAQDNALLHMFAETMNLLAHTSFWILSGYTFCAGAPAAAPPRRSSSVSSSRGTSADSGGRGSSSSSSSSSRGNSISSNGGRSRLTPPAECQAALARKTVVIYPGPEVICGSYCSTCVHVEQYLSKLYAWQSDAQR